MRFFGIFARKIFEYGILRRESAEKERPVNAGQKRVKSHKKAVAGARCGAKATAFLSKNRVYGIRRQLQSGQPVTLISYFDHVRMFCAVYVVSLRNARSVAPLPFVFVRTVLPIGAADRTAT